MKMKPHTRSQGRQPIAPEIVVEVAQSRREGHRLDPGLGCTRLQSIPCRRARRITVAQHVEPPQTSGKPDVGQVSRR